jgi:CRP-like cAMP-binding protein
VDGVLIDLNVLARVPLFGGLSSEELELVAAKAVRREHDRGAVIFFEHEPGDAMYIIEEGQVRIYRVAEDGREKTLALLSEGDFFGEMALIDDEPRSAIAEATEPCVLLAIHKRDVHSLIQANPSIALSMIQGLSRRLRETNKQLMDAVFLDVRGRVLRLLLDLDRRYGRPCAEGRLIDIRLTHQELANMVGTSRESVTRVLTELQDVGALGYAQRHRMWIDRRSLEEYMEQVGA